MVINTRKEEGIYQSNQQSQKGRLGREAGVIFKEDPFVSSGVDLRTL
jgi:hypothetical protein